MEKIKALYARVKAAALAHPKFAIAVAAFVAGFIVGAILL